jgi:hypothetical protein
VKRVGRLPDASFFDDRENALRASPRAAFGSLLIARRQGLFLEGDIAVVIESKNLRCDGRAARMTRASFLPGKNLQFNFSRVYSARVGSRERRIRE